jgi:hypothetical protein
MERARAYVRVDQQAIAALPELGDAIRAFQPVPGPAGESAAEWLAERALREPLPLEPSEILIGESP